jgi:hypothetical protein
VRFAPILAFLVLTLRPMPALAQDPSTVPRNAPAPIQDNSFLIEEAYNQEDGVIQHISAFEILANSHDWVYTLTEEWPLRTLKHQVSVTLAGTHAGSFAGSGAGWGDAGLNYRYQLVGSGEAKLAIAPRLTLMLPSGNHKFGRGSGGVGMQTNLPISVQHSSHLVSHWNVGATWVPHALNKNQESASTTTFNLGQSIVWLARPRFNVLLETLWTSGESVIGARKVERWQNLYLSPGVRWAHNFESGLQIVPGIAMPIGAGPSAGEKGVILYLSFEHPFSFTHSKAK